MPFYSIVGLKFSIFGPVQLNSLHIKCIAQLNNSCRHFLLLIILSFSVTVVLAQEEGEKIPPPSKVDTLPIIKPDSVTPVAKKTPLLLKIINTIVFGVKIGPGRLLSLPVVTYAPETSLGLGATFNYVFRFDKGDSTSPVSFANTDLLFTLRGQVIIEPHWSFILKHGKFRTAGNASFRIYPDYYFGIGNAENSKLKQQYQANYGFVKTHFLTRVAKGLFVGAQYSFEDVYYVKPSMQGRWDSLAVPGGTGYIASGFGAKIDYDTRDNVYYPFKGTYISVGNIVYTKIFGSNVYFNNITVNVRQFVNLYRSHVLAFQGYAEFNPGYNSSNAPFRMLSTFGGLEMMRGYYRWQYRDKNMLAFQMEYRFPIWWRFTGVVFGSTGDVYNQPKDLSLKWLKVAGGAGLRFTLDAKERVNIRIDYAYSRFGTSGFYFALGEAF